MEISRRRFLKISGLTASLGLVQTTFGQKIVGGVAGGAAPFWQSNTSFDLFSRQLGSEFYFSNQEAMTSAVLVEAGKLSNHDAAKAGAARTRSAKVSKENYLLKFRADSELPQATYHVAHSQLGSFDLFLVPGKNDAGENLLYAVINRL